MVTHLDSILWFYFYQQIKIEYKERDFMNVSTRIKNQNQRTFT